MARKKPKKPKKPKRRDMADWNLFCQIEDLPGDGRAKQGDIIYVRPASEKIPSRELSRYLIVPVSGMTEDEAYRLQEPQFSDGSDGLVLRKDQKDAVTIIGKRKHSVPVAKMQDQIILFDKSRMEDPLDVYQPYLAEEVQPSPKTEATVYDKDAESYRTNFDRTLTPDPGLSL